MQFQLFDLLQLKIILTCLLVIKPAPDVNKLDWHCVPRVTERPAGFLSICIKLKIRTWVLGLKIFTNRNVLISYDLMGIMCISYIYIMHYPFIFYVYIYILFFFLLCNELILVLFRLPVIYINFF